MICLSHQAQKFIQQSPFLLLASSCPGKSADLSPRGDMPGFVKIINGDVLQLPDRIGNNRLDSLENIILNPRVYLTFFIPGNNDVLCVSGDASVVIDPEVLENFSFKGKAARSVIYIDIKHERLYQLKAIGHARLWDIDTESVAMPSLGDILSDQIDGVSREQANEFVHQSYTQRLY